MNEQALQKKLIKYLEAQGYYCIKVLTASKRGVPDIIACSPDGRFVAIEVKLPGMRHTVTPLQRYNLDKIGTLNGISLVATSVVELMDVLALPVNNR